MKIWKTALCLSLVGAATLAQAAQPQAVTVYSARIEALLKPTLDEYTKQTGVKINLLTDSLHLAAGFDAAVAVEQRGLAVEIAEVFRPEDGIFGGDLEIAGGQMMTMEKKGAHC